MKRMLSLSAILAALFLMGFAAPALAQKEEITKTPLKVGDTAPDFALLDNKWNSVKLSDFRGKKNVVLAFYVLSFTGG